MPTPTVPHRCRASWMKRCAQTVPALLLFLGGPTTLTNNQVAGFIPTTSNVSLSWNYKKFGTRVLYSYTSDNIRSFNAAQPSRNQYMLAREMVNLGLTWQLRPNLTLQFDIANLFNAPQKFYRSVPDQLETFLMQGTTITAGVQGRF